MRIESKKYLYDIVRAAELIVTSNPVSEDRSNGQRLERSQVPPAGTKRTKKSIFPSNHQNIYFPGEQTEKVELPLRSY